MTRDTGGVSAVFTNQPGYQDISYGMVETERVVAIALLETIMSELIKAGLRGLAPARSWSKMGKRSK